MAKSKLTTKIRECRQKLGMTQEALAERVGVRRETIVFMEQGKYVPSLKLAYDIAHTFSVGIEDVFFFD